MKIPMMNLQPMLDATASQWRIHLEQLFRRMQFILGEQGASFERELAADFRARFAISVGSGTSALELCLRAAGLAGSGREVLVPTLTSPFTGLAILAAGCAPRFCDVDAASLLLDVDDARNRITRRTAALMPVHLYGQPCDMQKCAALARRFSLVLVQDACQAHGAQFRSHPFTEFSSWVAYSFYPTKNLGCLGDGGAILTNSSRAAARLLLLRDGGRRNDQLSRMAGNNSRLDEMQACYLRAFLPQLESWNAKRRRLATLYDETLRGCDGVHLLDRSRDSVNHLYVIRAARRVRLRESLARRGIMTGVHYPVPLHLQPAFRSFGTKRGDLPCAERACREILSLPLWPHMAECAVLEVARRIRQYYGVRDAT